jgi:hypothetical protein
MVESEDMAPRVHLSGLRRDNGAIKRGEQKIVELTAQERGQRRMDQGAHRTSSRDRQARKSAASTRDARFRSGCHS